MKQFNKDLGRVSLVPEGAWTNNRIYDKLSVVYNTCDKFAYVSKKEVPINVDIQNREYWQPLNVTGYSDDNIINLSKYSESGNMIGYDNVQEAIDSVQDVNRRIGCIITFYNLNVDRLDRNPIFEIWQFNSTDINDWTNIECWQNIYYNYNVFVGWYVGTDALNAHVPNPNVGQYAYVGSSYLNATIYRCQAKGVWSDTKELIKNFMSLVLKGEVTIGENGNWYSRGEDTGIPVNPPIEEMVDTYCKKYCLMLDGGGNIVGTLNVVSKDGQSTTIIDGYNVKSSKFIKYGGKDYELLEANGDVANPIDNNHINSLFN